MVKECEMQIKQLYKAAKLLGKCWIQIKDHDFGHANNEVDNVLCAFKFGLILEGYLIKNILNLDQIP
jgi:hypothetical protein